MIQLAINQMTDTERPHMEFPKLFPDLAGQYFRFNAEGDLYKINLVDYKQLNKVEQLANDFVASAHGKRIILNCVAKLAKGRRPSYLVLSLRCCLLSVVKNHIESHYRLRSCLVKVNWPVYMLGLHE
jgi:hypothetical protein